MSTILTGIRYYHIRNILFVLYMYVFCAFCHLFSYSITQVRLLHYVKYHTIKHRYEFL